MYRQVRKKIKGILWRNDKVLRNRWVDLKRIERRI
jgi:hypothetical protein